jgi:hypothetical protein
LVHALALSPHAFRRPLRFTGWLIPVLVVSAVSIISVFIVQDLLLEYGQRDLIERIEKSEQMSPEQRNEAIESIQSDETLQMMKVTAFVFPILWTFGACLLAALVLTLIVGFGFGGTARFAEMWFVACLAWAPHTIRSILRSLLMRAQESPEIHFGPAALVADDGGVLRRVLEVFDLFDFWMIGIHLVGVGVLTGLTKGKARGAVAILWITYWVLAVAVAIARHKLEGLV